MDRLVVGDVGFGKTEVAMAAALVALAAGHQVAVLAPTTVLARQHAALFAQRFVPLGFTVGSLTRFTQPAARAAAVAGLSDGSLSLIVGTHALLTQAAKCPRLGLLIVDEEQRFGVRHKDAIRGLHARLDVLTLSATPIPRTLHQAMAGFRDASAITTPPPGRVPIATRVVPHDEGEVRASLLSEVARGGQAFYVLPRIEAMAPRLAVLKAALPGVRFATAHGQMRPAELEAAMEGFSAGEADVLLCTTIVEAGLDLPRVNTIVVEDCHLFGLSSLYQLRGRVGRADRQAFCLLTWDPYGHAHESPEAAARLAAIRECAALGDGLKLSQRDLAIRGAGSLFGDAQSGDAAGVGPELQLQMLYEALHSVGEHRIPAVPFASVQLRLPHLRCGVPPALVASEAAARALTVRAAEAGAAGPAALKELATQVAQATGRPLLPRPFHALLRCHLLRWYCAELGVEAVSADEVGAITFATQLEHAAFEMLLSPLAPPDAAMLSWRPGGFELAVRVAAADRPGWHATPEAHVERAITCLASLHAKAPKWMKYV